MKQSERFELIDRLARELQARFKTYELNGYLNSMGVETPESAVGTNSKWVNAKRILAGESVSTLLKIAEDLNINYAGTEAASPPAVWAEPALFRLFISHVSTDKDKAMRLRDCLRPYGVIGFVAHEDIEPTKEWEVQLRRALHTMDALVSIHTPGFSDSNWTQQEIGIAVGRAKKIIAFRMGEDPTGFLSKEQALLRRNRTAEQIAEEINRLLLEDDRTRSRMADAKQFLVPDDEVPF